MVRFTSGACSFLAATCKLDADWLSGSGRRSGAGTVWMLSDWAMWKNVVSSRLKVFLLISALVFLSRGLLLEAEGERWNNKTSSWNVVHWELESGSGAASPPRPSRVDQLEEIQVEKSSQSQTDEFDPARRQLIFTVLPATHRQRLWGRGEAGGLTGPSPSVLSAALILHNPLQARARNSPRWVLLGRWASGFRAAASGSPSNSSVPVILNIPDASLQLAR